MGSLNKFKLFLGIFIPFLAFFLMSQNTFAENFNVYYRSYQIGSDPVVNQSGYNQTGSSVTILDYTSTQTKLLKGFSVENDITDGSTYDYKKLVYKLDLFQPATSGNSFQSGMNLILYADTTNGTKTSSDCSFQNGVTMQGTQSSGHALVTCSVVLTGTVRHAQLVLGTVINATSSSATIGYTMPPGNSGNNYGNASIIAYNVGYTLSGTNDPQMQYLNEISSAISNTNVLIQDQINQQNQNTQDIINNQNQNTQDIIRSNQNCRQSVNKFNIPDGTFTSNGITWTRSNGSLHGVGTLSGSTYSYSMSGSGTIVNLPSGTYTFSFKNAIGSPLWVEFSTRDDDNNRKIVKVPVNGTSATWTFSNGLKIINIVIGGGTIGDEYDILIEDVQVQEGSSATAYEPYGEEICKNINEEYYDEQRQADQNISNQNSSDIQGAENQQTTNLIGVLSNFLTQLQSFSATDCNLSLPFPSFIGGTQVVNICQGKDVLGNFITVIGTLAMVGFYIPLAVVLLKMIYNEIRSFTNG